MAKPLWRLRGPGLTISEFSGNGSPVWGECEKCGADTVDDSCGCSICCEGPENTAKCIRCGHWTPILDVITIKEPGALVPDILRCPCPSCSEGGATDE